MRGFLVISFSFVFFISLEGGRKGCSTYMSIVQIKYNITTITTITLE